MTHSARDIQDAVNGYIERMEYVRQPMSLYEPIRYTLSARGKRMRPVLMMMAYELFCDGGETIMETAVGLETYHNYTLLHDDLMDRSDLRRGRPTVHVKWDENTAILSGDTMLVMAYRLLTTCREDKLREVLDCFNVTALEVGEGQQYDMDFEQRNDVSEGEYVEMIRLKTSVLLACAMKIGGILSGARGEEQELLYALGESIGLAFQLQDDYLDVYGDEAVFGKPIGGDIVNNKKTYMLINALLRAKGEDREELEKWLGTTSCDGQEKVAAVTRLYDKLGIDRLAQEKIDYYFAEAEGLLARIDVSEDRKAHLREYIRSLHHREV